MVGDIAYLYDRFAYLRPIGSLLIMVKELTSQECRRACPKLPFDCRTTKDLIPSNKIIGQDRAVKALQFGLRIRSKGFNIYIAGMPGTGRRSAAIDFVKDLAKDMPVPPDWVYVYNFQEPPKPNALALPAGKGKEFKDDVEKMVSAIPSALKNAFESDEYTKKRQTTMKTIEEEREEITKNINRMTSEAGFQIQQSPIGMIMVPIVEDKPLTPEEFNQLSSGVKERYRVKQEELQAKLQKPFVQVRELEEKAEKTIEGLNREVAMYLLSPMLTVVKQKYGSNDEVISYIDDIMKDILDNLVKFLTPVNKEQLPFFMEAPDPMANYKVNLIVDNSQQKGAPVEIELNPSYYRLFGAIEKEARFGALVTNYTMIRGGSLHKANGGFIMIPVEGLFTDPSIWISLKQTISSGKLEIEEKEARLGFISTKSLTPEPIPFDTKIVIIGDSQVYDILYNADKDFKELFKIKADFDTSMERNDENIKLSVTQICTLCTKEQLLPVDSSGLSAIIEYSSRLADDQNKLSTRFSIISDIVREADFYAREDKSKHITKKHVYRQLEEKLYRSSMIQDKLKEFITKGIILIDTKEKAVGQVNGMAVLATGDFAFGNPSRITASIAVGREGIIDIERQSEMSGPSHTKGVLILSGYLNDTYSRERPLSLSARLVFEQNYGGVDGDSASSTELYCLLSALANIPIKQYIAVTGSVNQKGEVQAIGGVNEKIEGFFEVCKARGLTGKQGCMIPSSNVQNLMLKEEVVIAIKAKKFHIWPVSNINEGIEVLTDMPAGKRNDDGTFKKDTINNLVQKRLDEMAERRKEYRI
jgi:lon-related putative ATP-dependent protease